MSSSNNYKLS